jgi:exopolyphosphatase / guanosine-5'-triphosphate,3'-diphosphate pyrophosphatase
MDLAALDLGSNSLHLLVARANGARFTKLASEKRTLGLGRYVRMTGRLPAGVFESAVDAVVELIDHARRFHGVRLVVVGTSALRDAQNGSDFVRAVETRTGVQIEIVTGDVEARLVYEGARSGLNLPERIAVIDIGGGSVEIAVGEGAACTPVASLPLGFLRAGSARGVGGSVDLPGARERVAQIAEDAARRARAWDPQAWVFSGGTARAFASVSSRLFGVESNPIGSARVRDTAAILTEADSVRMLELGVDPARVSTLGAGAAVLAALVEQFQAHAIRVSPGGLREGMLLRELASHAAERRRPTPSRPQATAIA